MSFRFFRRMKLAPGISLNLSKSGPSLSFGPKGAKLTVGPRGIRQTLGIPGTGLYYTTLQSSGTRSRGGQSRSSGGPQPVPAAQTMPPVPHLDLGFFERLVTPPEEQAFVSGLREIVSGNKEAAFSQFASASHLGDSAFMAGWLCLEKHDFNGAEKYLGLAIAHEIEIGKLFSKYKVSPNIDLSITDELIAHLAATPTAARLAIIEVFQRQQRGEEAINVLQKLYRAHPEDPVIRLSIVELLLHLKPNDHNTCDQVVKLSEGIANESPVHAAILLYKTRALRGLGMPTAAIDTISDCLKKIKDYPDDLTHALRYEHALAYEDAGQVEKCRAELEKLYADAPDYEDVARRLGVK